MNIAEYRDLVHENTKNFDTKKALEAINTWLDNYLVSSRTKKIVMGISGGKDSTIVAKILVDKLGKENVIGLLMPNGEQKDINDSMRVVKHLGIGYDIINIKPAYDTIVSMLYNDVSEEARINIAPRIRMTTLYTYGQTHGCRVAGTGNLSEITLGYFTKHGDGAHDFNIIAKFTSLEVMRIGEELELPLDLVYKTPDDGLSGMSDEEKLGITYVDMHNYLRGNKDNINQDIIEKIQKMEKYSQHKREEEPVVDYTYFNGKLPELNKRVMIRTTWHTHEMAKLVESKLYSEGVVFQCLCDGSEIRVDEITEWHECKCFCDFDV